VVIRRTIDGTGKSGEFHSRKIKICASLLFKRLETEILATPLAETELQVQRRSDNLAELVR